jgi:hypothetical protein
MDKILQTTNATHYDRYPEIFSVVSEICKGRRYKEHLYLQRILSYGCSYGDEVKAFEEKYFTNDILYGVDINENCIENCKNSGINAYFFTPNDFNVFKDLKFDFVFCMSVLCKMIHDINEEPLKFEDFNNTCKYLDSKIKVGGYFIDYNSNYYFLDSDIGNNYEPIKHDSIKSANTHTIKYKPNGIDRIETDICIFKKIK